MIASPVQGGGCRRHPFFLPKFPWLRTRTTTASASSGAAGAGLHPRFIQVSLAADRELAIGGASCDPVGHGPCSVASGQIAVRSRNVVRPRLSEYLPDGGAREMPSLARAATRLEK